MRGYAPAERRALQECRTPPSYWDAKTPEGAFIDAGMISLVERGCATATRVDGGTTFKLTELGRIARRLVEHA